MADGSKISKTVHRKKISQIDSHPQSSDKICYKCDGDAAAVVPAIYK